MSLTIVLALLVLVATLILAIFTRTQGDRQASSLYTGAVEAGFLADTAVNLVIAQITDATQNAAGEADSSEPAPERRVWVSQPGLIRTFLGNRMPDENYRLYSWNPMRVSNRYDPGASDNAVPDDWALFPARYVDLNEPMPSLDDPADRALDRYPIFYPPTHTLSESGGQVEGFSVQTVPGGGASGNVLPMPVEWLYVLGDGTVHPPEPVSGQGSAIQIAAATAENPIVGRIAFWTDDESAKVNVNTSAGGEFWSPPWLETPLEGSNPPQSEVLGYGYSQPVKGEFQRYPGHPARTDLRAVFPELTRADIYEITPRVATGGSEDGTVGLNQKSIEPVVDAERLIAALGEMRFAGAKPNPGERTPIEMKVAGLDGQVSLLERRKAFLSASSRSPELTLFGTPRVAIWPIPELKTAPLGYPYRSPLDQLMAFCSTLNSISGANYYHFTRRYPNSPMADIELPRNLELYGYLQEMTSKPFPGVSASSFELKYGAHGRDQVLTEIFDYIRSTNLIDMLLDKNRRYSPTAMVVPTRHQTANGETFGFGRAFSVRQAGLMFIANADAAVAESNWPLEVTPPQGVMANRALTPGSGGVLQANQRRIQALFFIELFSPAAGYKQFQTKATFKVRGLENLSVSNSLTPATSLGFPDGSVNGPDAKANHGSYSHSTGGVGGAMNYRWPFLAGNSAAYGLRATPPIPADPASGGLRYPFVSVPVTVTLDPANPVIELSGGTIEIDVYGALNSQAQPVNLMQTVTIEIDPITLPAPTLAPNQNLWAFHKEGIFGSTGPKGRFDRVQNPTSGEFITQYDTVQTWILPHGDYRALFGPPGPLQTFVPVPAGGNTPSYPGLRHFLTDSYRGVYGAFRGTTLAPEANVNWTVERGNPNDSTYGAPAMLPPDAYPTGLNAPWTFGDWDTGSPWEVTDGPLINKADEGNVYLLADGNNPFARAYSLTATQEGIGIDYQSPNRQLPSPGMFGSLPTGLVAGKPWQTLLFRPARGTGHPGAADPADHLLLDLFWMPVVEPYAISEPFSTAGKINMNWEMIPFNYIERSTGIHALLRNEKIAAIPEAGWGAQTGYAKRRNPGNPPANLYYDIDVEESLRPYRERFSGGGVFITPSEVTTLEIVPKGVRYEDVVGLFWETHRLTGENIQERIYTTLYPRLTTRSNVFTVHYRVQQLRKPPGDPTIWEERSGPAGVELRGNTVIERYIDANRAASIVDYATQPGADAEGLYRFRILSNKRF